MRRAEEFKRGGQIGGHEVNTHSGWLLYMSPTAVHDKANNTKVELGLMLQAIENQDDGGRCNRDGEWIVSDMLKLPPLPQSETWCKQQTPPHLLPLLLCLPWVSTHSGWHWVVDSSGLAFVLSPEPHLQWCVRWNLVRTVTVIWNLVHNWNVFTSSAAAQWIPNSILIFWLTGFAICDKIHEAIDIKARRQVLCYTCENYAYFHPLPSYSLHCSGLLSSFGSRLMTPVLPLISHLRAWGNMDLLTRSTFPCINQSQTLCPQQSSLTHLEEFFSGWLM